MAYMAMTDTVMAYGVCSCGVYSYGLYSYGLFDYGLYTYGLYSYCYIVMAYIVMAYIVISYIVMAYIVMARQACATYRCVRGAASQCSVTCGSGTTTTTATCMASSNGRQTAVAAAGITACANCSSTTAPCSQPACVTYRCVRGAASQCSVTCGTGITVTTATCMAYTNGQQIVVPSGVGSKACPD